MDKYKRVYASIDLDALIHNVNTCKARLSDGSIFMPVVKADGYGHGAVPLSRVLVENGIERLAVATLEEAITLRHNGIEVPIMILGYTPDDRAHLVIEYDLIQTVYKYDMAKNLSKLASDDNKKAKIHIKLDTGMGRIGFIPHDASLEIVTDILRLPGLCVEGIFTHFSKADEVDKTYTMEQLNKFNRFVLALEDRGFHIPIKHTANSAGIIDVDSSHKDVVRLGISLYGFYPSKYVMKDKVDLQPVLSLISHIIHIKEVEAGTYIGYGGTHVTTDRAVIATIPVGYADGYDRLLSSKGHVLIRGRRAPIVGRICMDQFMVDITHIEDVEDLDEVVLIGKQGHEEITADEIAEIKGTINYEVVCQLGKRIPRVYIRNKQVVETIDYFE